ncbi:MAG: aminotransferase class V-fold PLP-dependent enzyme [Ruminococcus flavefaciens]|nr:aminotransferase class V-fold PLP-dependent enzyme [Ruminococcus flavefaciens]MCM1228504.1 aminotransferase class V-fold PLP-dependent enzyme [Ruminococcus flavefaciens]
MTTPVIDFLRKYADSNTVRCHMPGHKGMIPFDITEIDGADSLFEADGIIHEGEINTAGLYGSTASFWSASGSTLCIQAMLLAVKLEGRSVIAVRNAHRAFVNASALLGIDVEWILPDYDNGILSGKINPATVEKYLRRSPKSALYVTSPDYTGRLADIKTLAEICHRYNAVLLVDNAHGSHLAFMPENIHPIALGADMCCDSAHKMLVGLTGSAVLHTSSERYAKVLRQCMSMFASTSPSYLILASLDYCNRYISEKIRADIEKNLGYIADFRAKLPLDFVDGDPFHIAVNLGRIGLSALKCAEHLRKNRVECEYADENLIILLMSPKSNEVDYLRLAEALAGFFYTAERGYIAGMPFLLKLPEKAMDMRSAFFMPSEEIPVEQAEGRICASVKVPCPPAIPVAVCGEVINRECIEIYQRYGIGKVMVIK